MCWAFRFADGGVDAESAELAMPHLCRITRAGQEASILVRRAGKLQWMTSRFGISFPKSTGGRQLIWNARDDKLDKVETWTRLIRQRFVIPIDAYVENAPGETWFTGPVAWTVGLYDAEQHGGAVTLTESGDGEARVPILLNREDALHWLGAQQWEALPDLARARRVSYKETDLFESKQLSTDARTNVPLSMAA